MSYQLVRGMPESAIVEAIQARRLLSFRYKDERLRTVEPHALGENNTHHLVLVGWSMPAHGVSSDGGWRTYYVSDMRDVQVLESVFEGPRHGFNPLFNMIRVDYALPVLRVLPD